MTDILQGDFSNSVILIILQSLLGQKMKQTGLQDSFHLRFVIVNYMKNLISKKLINQQALQSFCELFSQGNREIMNLHMLQNILIFGPFGNQYCSWEPFGNL